MVQWHHPVQHHQCKVAAQTCTVLSKYILKNDNQTGIIQKLWQSVSGSWWWSLSGRWWHPDAGGSHIIIFEI